MVLNSIYSRVYHVFAHLTAPHLPGNKGVYLPSLLSSLAYLYIMINLMSDYLGVCLFYVPA